MPLDVAETRFTTLSSHAEFAPEVDRTIDFAGRYRIDLAGQFVSYRAVLDVDADGSICLRLGEHASSPCEFTGALQLAFTGAPFFDFSVTRAFPIADERYRGRGWLQRNGGRADRTYIVFVGHGAGQRALGLVGRRQ